MAMGLRVPKGREQGAGGRGKGARLRRFGDVRRDSDLFFCRIYRRLGL